MSTEGLEAAIASTRSVLANVRPDQYDAPTPCASWDVRAVINHLVDGLYFFAQVTTDGRPTPRDPVDYTAGDVMVAFDDGAARALAAFRAPSAMERMIELPFATMPGAAFIGLATTDQFAHGWDLARATGQDTDLGGDLADRLLDNARRTLPDRLRGPEGQAPFGVVQPTAPGASGADRLAAFLGRHV